jgi:hypothetical protein
MSPSLRLELTRLFFKLGAPGLMMGQRDAADFQIVGTIADLKLALGHDISVEPPRILHRLGQLWSPPRGYETA